MRQHRVSFGGSKGTGSLIMGTLVLIGFFILLFWVAKGVFQLLTYLAPIMIIAALIIRYKVVTRYFLWIWQKLQEEPLMGILYALLTVVGFPLVSAYLLFKAIAARKIDKVTQEYQERSRVSYSDYEVIEDHYLDISSEEDLDHYSRQGRHQK